MADFVEHRMTRRQFLRITAVAGVSLALGGGLIKALLQASGLHEIRETRTQMGTLVTISVVHPDAAVARQMAADAFAEMDRLEGILSRHREGTPISRLNSEGFVRGAPDEMVHLLQKAMEYSVLSQGAFDITVKPLLDLYASSFAQTGAAPQESQVQDVLSRVGHENLLINGSSVAFNKRGMSITLDGIAKGHIVDRTVETLKLNGAEQVLVDAGGDIGSLGDGSLGDGWKVAIQDPRNEGRSLGILRLQGQSVATSGDYLQYFTEDKSLHHILDPRTGRSPEHTSAVTIVAPTVMDADALTTALFVLGPRDGLRLLNNQPEGVEGLIVTKGGDVLRSKALSSYAVGF
jgi:thiamine biosynthesis lipoprotein